MTAGTRPCILSKSRSTSIELSYTFIFSIKFAKLAQKQKARWARFAPAGLDSYECSVIHCPPPTQLPYGDDDGGNESAESFQADPRAAERTLSNRFKRSHTVITVDYVRDYFTSLSHGSTTTQ